MEEAETVGRRRADVVAAESPSLRDVLPGGPRRAGPGTVVRLGLQRLTRSVRLLLGVGIGILVAAVLFGLFVPTIVLIDTIQLQNALSANGSDNNLSFLIPTSDYHAQSVETTTRQALTTGHATLRGLAPNSVTYLEYEGFLRFLQVDSKPILKADPAFPFEGAPEVVPEAYDFTQAQSHMRLLSGHLPSARPVHGMYEVLVPDGTGLKPGQVLNTQSLPAQTYGYFTGGGHTTQRNISFRVAGVWAERTHGDPYWNGQTFLQIPANQPPPSRQDPTIVALLMPQSTFLKTFANVPAPGYYFNQATPPPAEYDIQVAFLPNLTAITVNNLGQRAAQVAAWQTKVNNTFGTAAHLYGVNEQIYAANPQVATHLLSILTNSGAQGQQFALQLVGAVALVAALALLFIAAMADTLIASQRTQIVVLASRGASLLQIWGAFTVQAVLVAVLTLLVAPFLATALAILLVRQTVPASSVGNPAVLGTHYLLSSITPSSVLVPTALGALLAVAVISLTAVRAGGVGILALRQAAGRGTRPPFWQRFYLDLFLALLAVIAYGELANYGLQGTAQNTTQTSSANAVPAVDPVRTLAPLLLVLAGALVALRLLPLSARLGAWLSARGRGAVGVLAFTQAERAGTGPLALLLTLAVGISFFGFCFQATATQNATDRAGYLVGADERVVADETVIGGRSSSSLVASYRKLPGVIAVSPVYRDSLADATSNAHFTTLAIDPATFAQVAAWRDDYASTPLTTMLAQMRSASAAALASAKQTGRPPAIPALVSTQAAASLHLHPGASFTLQNPNYGNTIPLVVDAIVRDWPTLDPAGDGSGAGFIIADLPTYLIDISDQGVSRPPIYSPDEFWLRTNPNQTQALTQALAKYQTDLGVQNTFTQRDVLSQLESDPTQRGFVLLLLFGGPGGAALAILAALAYWALLARSRAGQLAILRTLGMRRGEILRMLLGEQGLLYGFGLLVGTALGVLLTEVVLPLLQLSSPPTYLSFLPLPQGLPPYRLIYPMQTLAVFYAVLLAFLLGSLLVMAEVARRRRLGQALRLGED